MAYNQSLFEKYKGVAKLPNNRRSQSRRTLNRRLRSLAHNNDNRLASDRRINDRRAIKIEVTVNCEMRHAIREIRDFSTLSIAFPNVEITRIKSLNTSNHILDCKVAIEDGFINSQCSIEIDHTGRYFSFRQLKGDLLKINGLISLSPDDKGTKISLNVVVEPGLPSFETFMGDVFKNKIRSVIRSGLERLGNHLGGIVGNECDYGFLVHTIPDYFTTTFSDSTYVTIPDVLSKYLLRNLPPFKCAYVTGVKSVTGDEVKGNLIYSPFAPAHFLTMDRNILLKHMIEAAEIAKDLGAKIIGLGAYTAFVGKRGIDIASAVNMPITTGTSYTIATALRALEQAAAISGLELSELTISIIGATGSIGKVCAETLINKVKGMILVARNVHRLDELVSNLKSVSNGKSIERTNDLSVALFKSDLVLISTNSPEIIIDVKMLRPGTILCDISQPRNVSYEDAMRRPDVIIIDGGVIEPPGKANFNFYFGLPPGLAYACMAETMILALEKRYESYSIGGNITAKKVAEIEMLGDKHGFKLAELKSFGHIIHKERFEKLRRIKSPVLTE